MEQRLGMSGATASRVAVHWFEWKRPKVSGLDMIVSEVDPDDRRYKLLYLNLKGRKFVAALIQVVNGKQDV